MKNKGCLLMRPLMLNVKSSENFVPTQSGKFWLFWGPRDQGLEKVSTFTAKGTSIRGTTSFAIFCVKIGWGCDLQVGWGKTSKESNKRRIFHIFTQKPPLLRLSLNLFWGQISRT